MTPTLLTQRLTLRPLSLKDFWFFFRLVGNTETRRYLGGPVPLKYRPGKFINYKNSKPPHLVWIVVHARTIGLIELSPHKDGQDLELSYQFIPSHWKKGFAQEAACEVVRYAFQTLNTHKIIAETQSANETSCKLLNRLGMTEAQRIERFGAEQIIFEAHNRS